MTEGHFSPAFQFENLHQIILLDKNFKKTLTTY